MSVQKPISLLLANHDGTYPSPDMGIESLKEANFFDRANLEVAQPPLQVLVHLLDAGRERLPPRAGRQGTNHRVHIRLGLLR